ncbi:MAG: PAS domain S-box protein [Chthonomonadales bacterium]
MKTFGERRIKIACLASPDGDWYKMNAIKSSAKKETYEKRAGTLIILLVEDNEEDFLIVRDLLQEADPERYVLEWVDTYEAGLTAIREQRHDLILMDYRLSNRTGLELLQETQSVSHRAPVIMLTGQGGYYIDVQAMEAGATDYLVKDRLNSDLLERAIRHAIERKRSNEALLMSEDRYRTFVENSMEGIWRFELEPPLPVELSEAKQIAHLCNHARVAECNKAMAHIYGFKSTSEVVGLSLGEFFSPDKRDDVKYLRRLIGNQYRIVNVETIVRNGRDEPTYVLHNVIGVVNNRLLHRIWGSQIDITETMLSNSSRAQIASIVATSTDAIISTNIHGMVLTWNTGAEAMYGYTAQEMNHQFISRIMSADHSHEMDSILARISKGERVASFDAVRRHKNGHRIDVSLSVSPLMDTEGRVDGTYSISRDISE